MTRKEEIEMICEKTTVRLLNDTFNKLTDKYECLLKEKTESEIDKTNDMIKQECPEYGAIVINLDGCELSFPYTDNTTIRIDNGDEVYSVDIKSDEDVDIDDVISFITKLNNTPFVKITTYTEKKIDTYNKKELLNNNKIKETKIYTKTFSGVYPKNKISAIYKLSGKLE